MRKGRIFNVTVVLLALSSAALAQTALPAVLVKKIDAIVEQARAAQKLPAVSVAVEIKGTVVFKKAYGLADLENNLPATPETLIRTGSIAKPMTAVGAMRLVEQGRLDLNAPVQRYCPEFPQKKWPVTIRHLLGHVSGIRHYEGKELESTLHYYSIADAMILFKNDPLLFEPGTKFEYTTYGYTVIGCAVEGASGQRFEDYMLASVLTPAGMTHTFVDDFRIVPHRARGYEKDENGDVRNAKLMDSSYKVPGGGYVSTPEDLVRFAAAVRTGRLLNPASLNEMWTALKTTDGKETDYGLGWGFTDLNGIRIYAHTGGQQGTSTSLLIMPSRDMSSAVMINMQYIEAGKINRAVADAVLQGVIAPAGR